MMAIRRKKTPSCRKKECHESAATKNYCRLHYITAWQERHNRNAQSKERMLDNYVKALTKRYPEQYLEVIKRDLASEKSFKRTVEDLDLENVDYDVLQDFKDLFGKKTNK